MTLRSALAAALLLPLAAACSPHDPSQPPNARMNRDDCGLYALRPWLMRRPGAPVRRVASGEAVRACAPPTGAEIESACESEEGVEIPGERDKHNPEWPVHAFPDHQVSGARCAFTDASRSRARCRFALAAAGAAPVPVRAELIYRYHDLSNNVMHEWHVARWEVDAICRPG